jgi:hypothetical protein
MNEEGHVPIAPSGRRLLGLVIVAAVAATLAFVLTVLPVEFRVDPTGFGRLVGFDRLAGPVQVEVPAVAPDGGSPTYAADVPFRSDTIEIPLKRAGTLFADETEFKMRLKQGAVVVYSWTVPEITAQDEFYYDFHGHSLPQPGAESPEVKVTSFRADVGTSAQGALIAPYDGLWGWYLQNQSGGPVVVRLRIAGYYEIATQEEIAAASAAMPPPKPPE